MTLPKITVCKARGEGRFNQSWFLRENCSQANTAESPVIAHPAPPVPATFKPLINGQETFETLHQYIETAEHSIDIAIWGFQPSMFFKRGDNAPCIGDLLIQKALDGRQVKILVWSMWFNLQTMKSFGEANLGNAPGLYSFQKKGEDFATDAQQAYDYWWYKALKGEIRESDYSFLNKLHYTYPACYNFIRLWAFGRHPARQHLQFKKRSVVRNNHCYPKESHLPFMNKLSLWLAPSHHQKTVLIDYEKPDKAIGFVLEHNMLDAYWDTQQHSISVYPPNEGKNAPTPLQDVSCLVTGQVLWDINHNFCQSWDREDSRNLVDYFDTAARQAYDKPLTPTRTLSRTAFPIRPEYGKSIMAQILRTYDNPKEEHIRAMYLENIKKATHFIYTENQYFRWTELVRAYQQHWQQLKDNGREAHQPLYWFVVTNSSDYGIGAGTYNTHEMLRLLGRQDVLPGVATQLDQDNSNDNAFDKYDASQQQIKALEQQLEKMEKSGVTPQDYEALQQKLAQLKQQEQQDIQNQYNEIKRLKRDVSDTVGIRAHICTLTSPEAWQEVYIHSKVTIIDDVFSFIGSANLNTRSMQVDTELGIIAECKEVANDLRYRLWDLHTNNNPEANPKEMNSFEKTDDVFQVWEELMRKNRELRWGGQPPQHPLCEFLRLTTDISRSD